MGSTRRNSINAKIKKEKYTNVSSGIPYIATKDVSYDSIINYDNGISIPKNELNNFRVAHENSIFICAEGGSAGRKLAFNTKEVCFVNKLFALEPFEFMEPKFIYYFYQTTDFQKQFMSKMTGLIGGVSMGKIKKIDILAPSLTEQIRIVAILDEAFENITKAKENAEKNLKNAKEVFESYLQSAFENKGEGWEEKKWGELCHFVRGPFGGSLKKSMFKDEGYVVYEQKHAIHDHFNQLRYFIDENKFNEMKRFEVKSGDIIMSCSGVTLGRVAIVPDNIPKGIINQALLKLTPNKGVSVHFIKHWLRSNIFQDIIFNHSGGAAIPNVPSVKILKGVPR